VNEAVPGHSCGVFSQLVYHQEIWEPVELRDGADVAASGHLL
jgi:hypothetical protein